MINNNDYKVGTIVAMKKPHPSKTEFWTIMKIGIDIKLKSNDIKNVFILIPRIKFHRQVKKIITK